LWLRLLRIFIANRCRWSGLQALVLLVPLRLVARNLQHRLQNLLAHRIPLAILQVVLVGTSGFLEPELVVCVVVVPHQLSRFALWQIPCVELG
jgi:hypothetical protein